MLTTEQIDAAKKRTKYGLKEQLHQHDDCIRIAYEWLDAQPKTKGVVQRARPLKHLIENWAGRYVSMSDVEVAAELHPDIIGEYPRFNISARLIYPSDGRLSGIDEAKKHGYKNDDREIKQSYGGRREPHP